MRISLAGALTESIFSARAWLNERVDSRWSKDPFGKSPRGTPEEYLALFEGARAKTFPAVDEIEESAGFAVDREWLDNLALHTQIVKKNSDLAYPHGRLLYALVRKYAADTGERFITILETGTARGFSALCMAKAIQDAGVDGRVVTFDVLPHLNRQYWNCIDDAQGKKSRAELLSRWPELTRMITFIHGDTLMMMPRVGHDRINFAFLDAQHIKSSVLNEFDFVKARQQSGDMVFFDDVTPKTFPGVVAALRDIECEGTYRIEHLTISEQRAYAWGSKID